MTASLVDHLFRHESARLVARLTRAFGPEHLQLAEDVVQEALLAALRQWPYSGVPQQPEAWLWRVARNRALDALRRGAAWRAREETVARTVEALRAEPTDDAARADLADDDLALIFLCCHPSLPRDSQVALTLKVAAGFGTAEIARAFLESEATVAQRLVRAKRKLRAIAEPFATPTGPELASRLDAVLEVLYLLFNEGYATHRSEEPVRRDLCVEALRLCELLTRLPGGGEPRVHALAALFCFQSARLPARATETGELLPLEAQDRGRWDDALVRRGLFHFERSARGEELTPYHLQAEIASCYALADTVGSIDWARIRGLYDELLRLAPSPVVALNRAVALSRERGAAAGWLALDELESDGVLREYCPYWVARAELAREAGRGEDARDALARALALAESPPLRRRLGRRLRELTGTSG